MDEPDVSVLAWTTTPWTLPSNLALCVNPKYEYVKVKDVASGKMYIVMAARLVQIYPGLGSAVRDSNACGASIPCGLPLESPVEWGFGQAPPCPCIRVSLPYGAGVCAWGC